MEPFLINLGLQTFGNEGHFNAPPASRTLLELTGYTLAPLALGMIIRTVFAAFAERAIESIRKSVLYLMIFVLVLGIVSTYQQILANFAAAGMLVLSMNLLSMSMGYGLARLFKLPTAQVVTLTFEVGVHNLALAFVITFNMLQRPDLAVAGLLYAVVMPATALAFVRFAKCLIAAEDGRSAVHV